MAKKTLGRLEPVDLRTVWNSEAADFTPWLAEEENLLLLGETLGLELELEAREKDVGPFSADILCREIGSGNWVLIENQLERTDHTHLGQLLTYSAGLKAVTIVWIASKFTDEHRAAIDWLNDVTAEKINFFGLEIELWRIAESQIAPKFNIVCQPNDWQKSVSPVSPKMTETKRLQLEFWTAYAGYLKEHGHHRVPKPLAQNWMGHSIGRTGFLLTSVYSTWNSEKKSQGPEVRLEFVILDSDAPAYMTALEQRRDEFEDRLGCQVKWHTSPNGGMGKVYCRRESTALEDRDHWREPIEWLESKLRLFREVFAPIAKTLEPVESTEDGPAA